MVPTPDFHHTVWHSHRRAIVFSAIGLVAAIVASSFDVLGVLHADDLTHYLFARESWRWPTYLLNDWGRPGFTIPYALPAAFGWEPCRMLSAILSTLAAWLGYLIAAELRLRAPWAVIPLCFLQPLFFKLAQTTLTETPLAFYLTLAVYLALRRRWTASSVIISLAFVTRHEAIIFLPIWLYYARREKIPLVRLWPILWAPIAINALASHFGVSTILSRLLNPASTGQYGRGGWLTYFSRSLEAFGPGIAVLAVVGFAVFVMERKRRPVVHLLPVACALAYFATQTVIRALGLYDSGGYARFLVPIGPLVAMAALAGWHELHHESPLNRRRAIAYSIAAIAVLWIAMERQLMLFAMHRDDAAELPELHQAKIAMRIATGVIVVIGMWTLVDRRMRLSRLLVTSFVALIALGTWALSGRLYSPPETQLIRAMNEWRFTHGHSLAPIISASVWIDCMTVTNVPPDRPPVRVQLERAPIGTCFAWDKQFAPSADHGISLAELRDSGCFKQIYESPPRPGDAEPFLRLFKKMAPWPAKTHR
ncbi:MAG: hypothetical protein HZA51_18095 [Planctomycetes bacterium]|nr:hypothetical protein [Planctomycetota bacterium]